MCEREQQLQLFRHDPPPNQKFDAVASEAARDAGIAQALESKASLLKFLRPKAEDLYRRLGRPISMDDVMKMCVELGLSPKCLGNSAGGFFEMKKWEWVGATKSIREWAHRNRIGIYRLKNVANKTS